MQVFETEDICLKLWWLRMELKKYYLKSLFLGPVTQVQCKHRSY